MTFTPTPGTVYFVGAGPGAPDLITVRGRAIIEQADLVLYADSLVQASVAGLARKPTARIIGSSDLHLAQIVDVMVEAARAGGVIARVHTGDPALFGATHEQMRLLEAHAIPYEVVPGVTAAFAAAARLGVELTVPEVTQTVILGRVAGRTPVPASESLRTLAAHGASLALYLSIDQIEHVVAELLAGGAYTPETPVAVVYRATWPDEQVITGTLAGIAGAVRAAGYTRHTLILVGPALRPPDPTTRSRLYDAAFTHGYRRRDASTYTRGLWITKGAKGTRTTRTRSREVYALHECDPRERTNVHSHDAPTPSPTSEAESRTGATPTRVVIAVTRAGAELGARLGPALAATASVPARFAPETGTVQTYQGPVAEEIRRHWAEGTQLVLIMATGVAVRAIAPLLTDKTSDPAVVCLDEAGRSVVPLLGGHRAGANALARRIAALTGGHAAVTTASDTQGLPALDMLGHDEDWQLDPDSALTYAMACLVNGEPLGCYVDPALPTQRRRLETWLAPCPDLTFVAEPEALLDEHYSAALLISHRDLEALWPALQAKTVRYSLPLLVVGLGCRRGVPAEELYDALGATLDDAGLDSTCIAALATVDLKAEEPGLVALADVLGVPLEVVSTAEVAALDRAAFSPSAARDHLDLPGVAEPSAVLVAGGPLLVPKRAFARCTVAVALRQTPTAPPPHRPTAPRPDTPSNQARLTVNAPRQPYSASEHHSHDSALGTQHAALVTPPAGHLTLVSLGPGDPRQMTLAAHDALCDAEVVVGYQGYIDMLGALLAPHQQVIASGMKTELDRALLAIEQAVVGRRVALVSSGDIGVYAMAGPVFETLAAQGWTGANPEVTVLPGISAFQAAAAKLGAAISHDFCVISLSDLLTPWERIEQRLAAAAAGDVVLALYNPRSRERHWQLGAALTILRAYRPPTTPVVFATNVTRPDEQITIATLADAEPTRADMFTVVLIGNSQSYLAGEHVVTPRGYAAKAHSPIASPPHRPTAPPPHRPTTHDYPVVLTNLSGTPAVVVGGGTVGERKIRGLLAVGARVQLISPAASPQLQTWAAAGRISWKQRPYTSGDLAGARLIFAATNRRGVNAQVAREAAAFGALCNVVDPPDEGSFHLPALHRAPDCTIAVSTSGAAPARAAALRDAIAHWLQAGAPEKSDER